MEALDALDFDKYDFLGFIEDNPSGKISDWPLLNRTILEEDKTILVLAVPGSPTSFQVRKNTIQSLNLPDSRFVSIIHPKASIGRNVQIGFNCLVMAGVVITSNAKLGNHVCVLPNSVIHHDTVVDDYVLIGSGVVIAGDVQIGANCYLGSGTCIKNNISIAPRNLIGIGSNVIQSVKEIESVWIGNPAKKLK